jgi:nicotinate dehydrogenase subunit A
LKTITLNINGESRKLEIEDDVPLLYLLRDRLGLHGPKFGCGLEQCGACMVLIDGVNRPTCKVPAAELDGKAIVTLKGLAGESGQLHPVQRAVMAEQAAQCGYCINGAIMSGVALFEANPTPDLEEIKNSLERNLCRCGTGSRIVRAFQRVAEENSRG